MTRSGTQPAPQPAPRGRGTAIAGLAACVAALCSAVAVFAQERAGGQLADALARSAEPCTLVMGRVSCPHGSPVSADQGEAPWRAGHAPGPSRSHGFRQSGQVLAARELVDRKSLDDSDAELDRRELQRGNMDSRRRIIGVDLHGGAKLGLRRKDGRPTVVYRAPF